MYYRLAAYLDTYNQRERCREREQALRSPVWFVPHATFTMVSPAREAIALGRGWAS